MPRSRYGCRVLDAVKRLSLGLILIAAAAAVLLLSDSARRSPADSIPRIAIVQHASQPIIDDGVTGMVESLAAAGYVDGKTARIRRYNAEGDLPTANAIANEITHGDFDLLLTATTLSLQTVANANRDGKIRHVFGLVSDPAGAGVGISRDDPLAHPPHLAGYGTLQPVAETLRLAKRLFPALRQLGVVWNPSEANSEANVKLARPVCQELGITLLEANAENSAAVGEAASSLVASGVDAIWVGGDVTAMTALETLAGVARSGRIPVFTSMPGSSARGSLFDLGADYLEVGRIAGKLAAEVLGGRPPARVAIKNVMPERLIINRDVVNGLKDPWVFPADILERATSPGAPPATVAPVQGSQPKEAWKISILEFVEAPDCEDARRGALDGLRAAGLREGTDYTVQTSNAQGDMATLSALVDAALSSGADLLLTLSTPTLQAALQRSRRTPIVFTFVADPIAAGAGRSNEDHAEQVTGVPTIGPYEELLDVVRECLPNARRLGTLFVPAEVNSVANKKVAEAAASKRGFELISLPVNTSTEIADAALSLTGQNIDAIVQVGSNLTTVAFASITQAADRAHLPLFGILSSNSAQGAAVSVARDYYDGGVRAGHLAARVIAGENPKTIPFEPLTSVKLLVNREAAQRQGLVIPASVLQRAADEDRARNDLEPKG